MRLYTLHEKLAVLVNDLDAAIANLNNLSSKTGTQQKKLSALVNFRKEIIETNRKTVFFDEFKYRRRLSDVYLALCFALEPFSPSKVGAIEVLEDEFEKITQQFSKLNK
jgi:hypothetical protein